MDFLMYPLPEKLEEEKARGNFDNAKNIIKYYLSLDLPEKLKKRLEYEMEILELIQKDYGISERKAINIAIKKIKNFSKEEFFIYKQNGMIDYKVINGKVKYFNRFFQNLMFLDKNIKERA
ncbi:MAG: transglutaminase domain-containing protein, partial [Thermoplasmata archaeon]